MAIVPRAPLPPRSNNGARKVAVRVPPKKTPPQPKTQHPTLYIINEQNQRLYFPYAPRVIEHGGLSGTYTEVARSGRVPLVVRTGDALPTMSFELFLGTPNAQTSVETLIRKLRSLGNQRQRLTIGGMGPNEEAGPWRMTSLSLSSVERQHGTNHITRCTAQLAFTKVSDAARNVGPISGGVNRKTIPGGSNANSTGASGSSGGGSSIGGSASVTGGSTSPGSKQSFPRQFVVTTEASVFVLSTKIYGNENSYRAIRSTSIGSDREYLPIPNAVLKRGQVVMLLAPGSYAETGHQGKGLPK